MDFAKRFAMGLMLLGSLTLGACSGTDKGNKDTDPECDPTLEDCEAVGCTDDSDCPDQINYMCNLSTNQCEPACVSSTDCLAHPAFDGAEWDGCEGQLGCSCQERRCVPKVCSVKSDCPAGNVCRSGACAQPDPDSAVSSCQVYPSSVVMKVGQVVPFTAVPYKADGSVALTLGTAAWTSATGLVTSEGEGKFKGATEGPAADAVKATFGSVSCFAKVTVLTSGVASGRRVVVVDEMTGRPVSGAKVVWHDESGATPDTAATQAADTDASGVLAFPSAVGSTVSVFHPGYNYLTLVGLKPETKDLYLPIRRNSDITNRAGGFKGKFTNFPNADVAVGLTGASFPGNFTDLDFNVILGPTKDTSVSIGGQTQVVPLPSGVTLGLNLTRFKDEYQALGVYGTCGDESKELAGTCGTRSAWSLMGQVKMSDVLTMVEQYTSTDRIDPTQVLKFILPNLRTFKSQVARDVSFDVNATVAGAPDFTKFTVKDLAPQLGLYLRTTVQVPMLPPGIDAALVLAGAQVPGRGMVPLGLTAGTDVGGAGTQDDGMVVGMTFGPNGELLGEHDDGKLDLRSAPANGGIEGSQYTVVALATPPTASLPDGALVTSGVARSYPKLPNANDPTPVEVAFPGNFLPISEAGEYDYLTGKFTGATHDASASVHRAIFADQYNRRWVVYYNGADFEVPLPPDTYTDRTMLIGNRSGTGARVRSNYILQELKMVDGTSAVGMDELFAFHGNYAMRQIEFTNAFSTYQREMTVAFTSPETPETCVETAKCASGRSFRARVKGYTLDGAARKVKMQFGAGSTWLDATPVSGSSFEATADFNATQLPFGAGTVTVRLVEKDSAAGSAATPLDPPVEQTIWVNVTTP